jgi:ABC-2 type transport system ATP-binding protein
MIEVNGLTRRFGAHVAVDDISFEVDRGEVVGFLGLNGAGKTTTLRVLAGYLPATSGSVKVAGFDVLRDSIEVRRRIGYLPENVPLYREQRVEEMLTMQARLHGVPRAERERRIGEVLERVGVLDRRRQVIAGLSRGLRQRVGLAVALLPKPEVLILDEPTSGLDPMQRQEVRVLLRELSSDHTVLLSSHILPEVEAVCPRTIIIHRGKIVADGTKEEMVRDLGRGSRVRLEAFFGADLEGALKSLSAIAGAGKIHDLGRLGIHHVLEIEVTEDLREDFGALAHMKGWALRELSYQEPSLEQVFARIAIGAEGEAVASPSAPVEEAPKVESLTVESLTVESTGLVDLQMSSTSAQPEAPQKEIYSLNPFDGGATRDLSRPTGTSAVADDAPERCDDEDGPL